MSLFRYKVNYLLKCVQKGDKEKFAKLWEETYSYMKYIAIRYVHDKNEWQDVLSEAYLRVLSYNSKANTERDGYNWLCKIVQNVAYDFNKKNEQDLPLESAYYISAPNTFGQLFTNDEVAREMEKLTDDDKQLIAMRFFDNMTYSKMADILNSKKSTIYKRLQVILDNMKSNINEEEKQKNKKKLKKR